MEKRERKYKFNVVRQQYNGVQFRSRLEARWAVWFDAMGIPYVYEPEGVVLWRGGVYLPDFYLPRHHGGVYCEVKPNEFTEDEKKKCRMLCRVTQRPVIMLDGAPEPIIYGCYLWDATIAPSGDIYETDVVLHAACTHTERRFYSGCGEADRWNVGTMATDRALDAYRAALGAFSGEAGHAE